MKRLMVDTNVYSNAMRGQTASVSLLQRSETLMISPIVLGELLYGFKYGSQPEKNREILRQFLSSPRVELVAVTPETSEFYASVHTSLRNQGTPIPTNDIWIAASTLEHGAHLATVDKHFQQVPGLLCVQPGT